MKLTLSVLIAAMFVFAVVLVSTGHQDIVFHVLAIFAVIAVLCAIVYIFLMVLKGMAIDSQD